VALCGVCDAWIVCSSRCGGVAGTGLWSTTSPPQVMNPHSSLFARCIWKQNVNQNVLQSTTSFMALSIKLLTCLRSAQAAWFVRVLPCLRRRVLTKVMGLLQQNCAHFLKQALAELAAHFQFSPSQGRTWKFLPSASPEETSGDGSDDAAESTKLEEAEAAGSKRAVRRPQTCCQCNPAVVCCVKMPWPTLLWMKLRRTEPCNCCCMRHVNRFGQLMLPALTASVWCRWALKRRLPKQSANRLKHGARRT